MDKNLDADPAEQRFVILSQISTIEAKSQRAMREHALGDGSALQRLQQYDTAIAELRAQLTPEN